MKNLNKNSFKLLRQDEFGTGGRTASNDEEVNKTPAQLLAEKQAAERAAAAAYDAEQRAIEAEHNAQAAASRPAPQVDNNENNYNKGGKGYERISKNIDSNTMRDYENGQFKGTDIRDVEKVYNKVRGMTSDEQNALRQEYAKGHYTLEGMIANALLSSKIGRGEISNIQAAGDTSNTAVAKRVVQNSLSGDSNVITPKEPEPETKPTEDVGEVREVAYAPDRAKIQELISKRDRGAGIDYPSVYTAYKNGLFGDPNDPDAKRTYASFLVDHIAKTLGNRSTFHAVGNRVDQTKAEDVGGQQSLFDEKIKKDWTSQIDRYNKQQDAILEAKTNVIADNISKLGNIQNNQDAIDFALSLKTRKPEDIQKLINVASSEAALNGQATPEMVAMMQNPQQLADLFVTMEKAKVQQAQLGNIAASLSNQMAGLNLDTAKKTQLANILNPYLSTAGNIAGTVSKFVAP